MSAPLVVSIPHRLGREEATRRLKAGLTRAASSIPVLKVDEERWDGDRMIFRVRALGQAASGHLDVADDHVRLEVTLPWLLQRFAEVAQVAIRNRGKSAADQARADVAVRCIALQQMKLRKTCGAIRCVSLLVTNFPEILRPARGREPTSRCRHDIRQAVRPFDPGRPSRFRLRYARRVFAPASPRLQLSPSAPRPADAGTASESGTLGARLPMPSTE